MFKGLLKFNILLLPFVAVFFSCKKEGPPAVNIPDLNHMQFTINDSVHYLNTLQAYTDSFTFSSVTVTTIAALNSSGNAPGENMTIQIYHEDSLKAGDKFVAGTQNSNFGADFYYVSSGASNAPIGISFLGYPGSITITETGSTYIKGTFSVALFPYTTNDTPGQSQPLFNVADGSFYATIQ
jgi:hypothetical protein